MALTATAVPTIRQDICRLLCLQDPEVLVTSFNRPNIYYCVHYLDLLGTDAIDVLKDVIHESRTASGDQCFCQ